MIRLISLLSVLIGAIGLGLIVGVILGMVANK